jgi:isoleucyl-tRNA synthetase
MFKKVDPKLDLPKVEEGILKFWDESKIFEKSLENRKGSPLYVFYDGPPFATGTPHYGHIVPSLMKDVVPRYFTMKGRLVERKWGWDCHGLPIENIAEKELGIKSKKQIEEMGVVKFNEFCHSKVSGYVDEWKKVIRRLGRWVDMENAYKTMDLPFMESVWWTFKQLYDKGLIYEGYRSMHVCPRCETTLSQSEVAEGYKDIKDLSVIAEFRLIDDQKTSILAWTTTPWTLLGNVVLAVGEKIEYVKIEKKDQGTGEPVRFILAKNRLSDIFKNDEYKIIEKLSANDLVGKKYKPLFEVDKKMQNAENGWKVVAADFVSTDDGTGVVHIAPAFGEDDMNLGKEMDLPFIQHVGMDGIIKSGYGELSGLSVKPRDDVQSTDVAIIKYLANKDLLFDKAQYEHSYPHCWRCDTPLINYATSSWFIAVEKIKAEAIELAEKINWTPKHLKKGRFGMWLEGARDWSISRQRYWASAIPIWRCAGKSEIPARSAGGRNSNCCGNIVVIGSVEELENLSSKKVTDLHKHIIDGVTFKCKKCDGVMKRIPDVLDTWFDSGSMPYAQMHYPFENKEKFESNFPAEFIAEGVDQTRCWFYYLHVISTAIMKKPAYKNVIANGIVLAEDGKKMSKRLKNYPDPMEVFEKYGADVLRLHLLSSPVMLAENLSLKESELSELQRGFFRMLWNSYYFFILYATLDNWKPENKETFSENILDRWIIAKVEKLNMEVEKNLENYNLPGATRLFPVLTNFLIGMCAEAEEGFGSQRVIQTRIMLTRPCISFF